MFAKTIVANLAVAGAAAVIAHVVVPDRDAPSHAAAAHAIAPPIGQRLAVQASSGAIVTVRVGDLDLASRAGAQAMLRRIDNAARQVCGPAAGDACVGDAVGDAIGSLASPQVAALQASRITVLASAGE